MAANLHQDTLDWVADKAARLREVRKELLRQQPGTTQRWFQGPQGCDVFLWYDDAKGLTQAQLTFSGRVVEWDAGSLRTGRLTEFFEGRGDEHRILFDRRPDPETMDLARVFLEHAAMDDVTRALLRKVLGVR